MWDYICTTQQVDTTCSTLHHLSKAIRFSLTLNTLHIKWQILILPLIVGFRTVSTISCPESHLHLASTEFEKLCLSFSITSYFGQKL